MTHVPKSVDGVHVYILDLESGEELKFDDDYQSRHGGPFLSVLRTFLASHEALVRTHRCQGFLVARLGNGSVRAMVHSLEYDDQCTHPLVTQHKADAMNGLIHSLVNEIKDANGTITKVTRAIKPGNYLTLLPNMCRQIISMNRSLPLSYPSSKICIDFMNTEIDLCNDLVQKIMRIEASADGTDPLYNNVRNLGTQPEVLKMTKLVFMSLRLVRSDIDDSEDDAQPEVVPIDAKWELRLKETTYTSNMSNVSTFLDNNPVSVILIGHCKTGTWFLVNHCNPKRSKLPNFFPSSLNGLYHPSLSMEQKFKCLRATMCSLTHLTLLKLSSAMNIDILETLDIHTNEKTNQLEPSLLVKRISERKPVFDIRAGAAVAEGVRQVSSGSRLSSSRHITSQLINTSTNAMMDRYTKALIGTDGWSGYAQWSDLLSCECPSVSNGLYISQMQHKHKWDN